MDIFEKTAIDYISLGIAFMTVLLTCYTVLSQRRFYRLSVKPFFYFYSGGFSNEIIVEIGNTGPGIMIISELSFVDHSGNKHNNLVDIVSKNLFVSYNNLGKNVTLKSGDKYALIKYKDFSHEKGEELKQQIEGTTLFINYKDVYGKVYKENYIIQFSSRPNSEKDSSDLENI